MRHSFGFILSFIFHIGLGVLAIYGVNGSGMQVDMDRPVYTVDLLSLAPPPPGPPVVVEAKADPVTATPETPVVEAKPEPVVEVPPKVVEAKAEEISPKKVEKKKIVKKKPKPEPKPKPKPKKTAEQLLKEGMKAAKAEAKRQDAKKAKALADELAALKKKEGDQVYAHGGQPGGVEGGKVGGVVGGTGSGLSEVYGLIVGLAIKKNWRYPALSGENNLLVVVGVQLDATGKIISWEVVESSNNPEFDSSALRAVKETEYVAKPKTPRDQILRINFNSQELAE